MWNDAFNEVDMPDLGVWTRLRDLHHDMALGHRFSERWMFQGPVAERLNAWNNSYCTAMYGIPLHCWTTGLLIYWRASELPFAQINLLFCIWDKWQGVCKQGDMCTIVCYIIKCGSCTWSQTKCKCNYIYRWKNIVETKIPGQTQGYVNEQIKWWRETWIDGHVLICTDVRKDVVNVSSNCVGLLQQDCQISIKQTNAAHADSTSVGWPESSATNVHFCFRLQLINILLWTSWWHVKTVKTVKALIESHDSLQCPSTPQSLVTSSLPGIASSKRGKIEGTLEEPNILWQYSQAREAELSFWMRWIPIPVFHAAVWVCT